MKKLILFVFIIMYSCGDDDRVIENNNPPNAFSLLTVDNESIDVDINPQLSWQSSIDPNGDAVTYKLYIDENEQPSTLITENLETTNYTLSNPVKRNTTYYWRVEAVDEEGNITRSEEIFRFSTRGFNFSEPVLSLNAVFSGRFACDAVVNDNKLWVYGGITGSNPGPDNDIWYTEDGNSWGKIVNEDLPIRSSMKMLSFQNKIWVIAGQDEDGWRVNDVWSSSDLFSGEWTQETANADFSKRSAFGAVVFNNKMWVLGGWSEGLGRSNDIWNSEDGENWTQVTPEANFSGRSGHQVLVFDNKMWIISGFDGAWKKDVWYSEDGVNWTQATNNAEFGARRNFSSLVIDDKMWVLGGYLNDERLNDVWYSEDGVNWTLATDEANYIAREFHEAIAYDNKIWVIAGTDGGFLNNTTVFN